MKKEYRAVVVATDPEEGILSTKRADSIKEVDAFIGSEIVRLISDFEGDVTLHKALDGYGEPILAVKYHHGTMVLHYKVCVEREEENDTKTD